VEVGTNWGDYTVQCRIDVVTPNLLVCTKGALILRDNGTDGYVFALHVATKTIEVYRLSNHEMLLSQDAPLELQTWYLVRAELQGTSMSFFVDGQLIGTVTDARSLSGAVGVAVQDTLETLFDDFTITGPDIPSNGLELSVGQKITLSWPSFLTNYVLKATSDLSATGAWNTVTNTPLNTNGQLTVTLDPAAGHRFYLLAPKGP
jgi:NAD(P)H-hydrate repair Nnr-like enzyme with NAD(P)H-hydrate epimerase domain